MSFTDRKTEVVTRGVDNCHVGSHFVVRQSYDDYRRGGFVKHQTTFATRRVIRDGVEELQIEVEIADFGKRTTKAFSSFVLPKGIADEFVQACAHVRGHKPAEAPIFDHAEACRRRAAVNGERH